MNSLEKPVSAQLSKPARVTQPLSETLPETTFEIILPRRKNLLTTVFSLLPQRLLGFSIVGGSVLLEGLALLFILVHFLQVEPHIAYFIQAVVSVESNFFLNRFLNWKGRDGHLFAQWLKFHATNAFTFVCNLALFALLTWVGLHYLLITLLGAALAAAVNYLANDHFVFHLQDIARKDTERIRPKQVSTRQPHIGVVIPVRNSQRTIMRCITSVLEQDYRGAIDIFLVGNLPQEDKTWEALESVTRYAHLHIIQVPRPTHITGRDANMKRYMGSQAAIQTGADIIALLDSQVEAPPDWLSKAVALMEEHGTDGLAGQSCHLPTDRSLAGIYQDGSIFSEWPEFGEGFVLRTNNFGQQHYLPITANWLFTREALLHMGQAFPSSPTNVGWDDFEIAWQMVQRGCTIYCTNQLRVYRNHVRKFRLCKQFSSGLGAVAFYRDNPDCTFAHRRIFQLGIVLGLALLTSVALLFICTMGNPYLWTLTKSIAVAFASLYGVRSVWKARDIRGLLFLPLDILHIGLWVAGAVYALFRGGFIQPTVASTFVRLR